MKKNILIVLLFVACAGTAMAAFADLTGKWVGAVLGPDGNSYQLSYTFKTEGEKLTGTVETPLGAANIENGQVKGNEFTFSANLNGTDIPHKGKYYTDSIAVNLDYNGTAMHATLKRAAK